MSDPKPSEAELHFLASFTQALIAWNKTENASRFLLGVAQSVDRDPHFADHVMAFELGSRSLTQAMQTLAYDFYEGAASEGLKHAADYFDALIVYRNYYMHTLVDVYTKPETGKPTARLSSMTAKSKIVSVNDELDAAKLQLFHQQCETLERYCGSVAYKLRHSNRDGPEPWPDKPPLPEQLSKNSHTMRELRNPRPASPQ